jgi:hypothetical protein
MNASDSPAQRLQDMGFRKFAEWVISSGKLKCEFVADATEKNVLYAFISNDVVLYVGKSVRSLKKRMYNYQNPGPTQSTSVRCNKLIFDSVASGQSIEVFALHDNGLLYYGGFHVNLAAGLEDSLVSTLKPAWNVAGI